MNDPSLRTSRVALAGGLAALMVVGGGGFFLGRSTSARNPAPPTAPPVAVPVAATIPAAEQPDPRDRVLARADLLALAAQAADALASGTSGSDSVTEAAGRKFELRIPFGCQGPAAEASEAAMRWRYDPVAKALRIHVAPAVWPVAALRADIAQDAAVAVEGFWIPRPWTASETCAAPGSPAPGSPAPVPPATSGGDAAEDHTLAIAQVFGSDGVRQGLRGDKPYETVVRMAPDDFTGDQGLRLRISGRIADIPGGGPVSCRQPAGPAQRPVCIIGVVNDEVAIENPATGEALATWTIEGRDTVPN